MQGHCHAQETTANNKKPVKDVDGSDLSFNPSRNRKRKPTAKPPKKYADTTCMKDFLDRSRKADKKEWQRQDDEKFELAELGLLDRLDHLQAMMWNTAYSIAIYALLQRKRMTRRERAAQGEFNLVLGSSDMSKMIAYNIIAHAIKDKDLKFLCTKST